MEVKKKVVKKVKKTKIKFPTRWITHTIKDTRIEINEFPNTALLRHEYHIGEWCRYENCEFVITLTGEPKSIYFDECIFDNCTFTRACPIKGCKIDIMFTSCDFNNVEFEPMENLNYIGLDYCTINGFKPKFNTIFRLDQIIFSHCYTLTNVSLGTTITDDIGLLDNMEYKDVDLSNVVVSEIRFRDKHLLKYYDEKKIKFTPGQIIDYERIGELKNG